VGAPAVDALKAAADGPDGMRRQQARLVLDHIAVAEVLAPIRVHLKLEDALPSEAVKTLAERTGVPMLYTPPTGKPEKRITLDLDDVSMWEALDRICEASEMGYAITAANGVHVSQRQLRPTPTRSYPGPFALDVQNVTFLRSLTTFGAVPQTTETLALTVGVLKQPSVRLLHFQVSPRITEATDANGQSLLPAVPPPANSVVVNNDSMLTTLKIALMAPEGRNGRLKVLKGVMSMGVMTRIEDLATVPDITRARGRTFHGGQGVRVMVGAAQLAGQQWNVSVRLIGPPGWRFDPNQCAMELVDAKGRYVRTFNPALVPTPLREPQPEDLAWLTAAPDASGLAALPWPALARQSPRQEWMQWTGVLHFTSPVALEGPIKLRVYRYDRLQAEVPFELRDVPLP
jgi:hypothetical protein